MPEKENSVLRQLKFTDLLIAAPLIHLTCSGLFLIGYCWYFGGLIAEFAGPTDIFAVSIGDIGPLYLLSLFPGVAYLIWMRARTGAWTAAEAIELKPDGPQREAASLRRQSDKKFFGAMMLLMAAGAIINMIIGYFRWGYIPIFLIQTLVLLGFVVANVYLANKLDLESPTFHLTYIFGTALIYSCFSGMARAQLDYRLTYSEAARQRPVCGDYAVLRKLSDSFLAVDRRTKHALIDESCKQIFRINS